MYVCGKRIKSAGLEAERLFQAFHLVFAHSFELIEPHNAGIVFETQICSRFISAGEIVPYIFYLVT